MARIEGSEEAIEYTSLCLDNKAASKRRKNREKRANRKKNKQMRKLYAAGLAFDVSIVSSVDTLCIRDNPDVQVNLGDDEENDGNGLVSQDNTGHEATRTNDDPLPRLCAAGMDLVPAQW